MSAIWAQLRRAQEEASAKGLAKKEGRPERHAGDPRGVQYAWRQFYGVLGGLALAALPVRIFSWAMGLTPAEVGGEMGLDSLALIALALMVVLTPLGLACAWAAWPRRHPS